MVKVEQFNILEHCLTLISSIIEFYKKNKHLELIIDKSPMTLLIIPNVTKIMMEKILVQKHLINNKNDA